MPVLANTNTAVPAEGINVLVPLERRAPISVPRMSQVLSESPDVAGIAVYGVMTILIDSADISLTHYASIVSECGVAAAVADVDGAVVDVAVGFDTGESLAN